MRHVIIGGNGFLGKELARQILSKPGERVTVVDLHDRLAAELSPISNAIDFQQADISISGALDKVNLGPGDAVHHLASKLIVPNQPKSNRYEYFASCSIEGTKEILRWMRNNSARSLVFWSTDMVYGPAIEVPRPESHPRNAFGPYGVTKAKGEDIIAEAVSSGVVDCTIFRPRLIIGPGRLGILVTLFDLAKRGWPIPLIGNGENRFQFASVSDCARASILAVENGFPNATYNLGSAHPPKVYDLMSAFLRRTGSRSRLVRTPGALVKLFLDGLNYLKLSPLDPEQYKIGDLDVTLDITAAERDLGWKPLDDDTAMLIAAYESFSDWKS